jgi:SOS response regulatory protein OraA/RecX
MNEMSSSYAYRNKLMSEAVSQEILHAFITQVSHEAWSQKINKV